MIRIRGLYKSFGPLEVLRGVDLEVPKGGNVVILGRSGGGKSVLLKVIIGLLVPDRGSVEVDGMDVTKLDSSGLAGLRRHFGMVFQMAALFDSMTVAENVGLALSEQTDKPPAEIAGIVREKLALVGLTGIEEKRPADLSGGMRKRVGLARAIAMDPDYILYDEPTTGLDPITAEQINLLIRDLQRRLSVTAVVVTHDIRSALTVGDRLCLLVDGKICFEGTPEEITRSEDPQVRQFIRGEAEGPLTANGTAGHGREGERPAEGPARLPRDPTRSTV